jgi:Zn-dependent protease
MIEALEPSRLVEFLVWFVVFLFSLTLHEAAHALFAKLGGDDTAYLGGQVTLNPLPHVQRETMGTVIVPILSFFMMGWMMGWASTPYDPHWAARHPKRQAAMSAAGPCANLLIAFVAFAALRSMLSAGIFVQTDPRVWRFSRLVDPALSYGSDSMLWPVATTLSIALTLNLLLFVFNLLPIPPMDGAGIVHGLFPDSAGRLIESFGRIPMAGLIGLVIAWQLIPFVFSPLYSFVLALLYSAP